MKHSRALASILMSGTLAGMTTVVLRRMEGEYERTDTLSNGTVTAMYSTYAAHAAALTWGATRGVWPVPLAARGARLAGSVVVAGGAAFALAGAAPFGGRASFGGGAQLSGIDPGSLHAKGVYRCSRNPQYLGLGLLAGGVAVATRSGFAGLDATGVWLALRRWIPSEERHLTRVFGERYTDYQARVRRWLGTRPNQ